MTLQSRELPQVGLTGLGDIFTRGKNVEKMVPKVKNKGENGGMPGS